MKQHQTEFPSASFRPEVLAKAANWFDLKILEAIHINRERPALNSKDEFVHHLLVK